MENTDAQAAALWKKFYIITTEMYRFIKKDKVDTFFILLEQRMELQKLIEKLDNKTYHKTPVGKTLISKINPINVKIRALAQSWLIRSRNMSNKVHSYDMNTRMQGIFFNKKL
ncbi:hypothetical protein [Pectinatus haikarae]|uniref:Uncharacterized protein n=1 Tax=Pectinatus haikarae TaxID=349096 RepID=A0ABT9YBC8_9FIRM|nr:hypothetical protein [Pectinatus haikarae]MDQ0205150.1 hypothetical protein [Pectinatus haikarae]